MKGLTYWVRSTASSGAAAAGAAVATSCGAMSAVAASAARTPWLPRRERRAVGRWFTSILLGCVDGRRRRQAVGTVRVFLSSVFELMRAIRVPCVIEAGMLAVVVRCEPFAR